MVTVWFHLCPLCRTVKFIRIGAEWGGCQGLEGRGDGMLLCIAGVEFESSEMESDLEMDGVEVHVTILHPLTQTLEAGEYGWSHVLWILRQQETFLWPTSVAFGTGDGGRHFVSIHLRLLLGEWNKRRSHLCRAPSSPKGSLRTVCFQCDTCGDSARSAVWGCLGKKVRSSERN